MPSIFISHDWNESVLYDQLTALLELRFGNMGWTNLSVPKGEAIQLVGYDRSGIENSLDRLEDEIIRVQAALRRPGLPTSFSRVVWDVHGNRREEDCFGSLEAELHRLLAQRSAILGKDYVTPPEYVDPKGASSQIRLHPELSLAIRKRILRADAILVLVTPFCRLRRWVDFEIRVAATSRTKVIAVVANGYASPDFYIDCRAVVTLDPEGIRDAFDAAV
jgi:hypothetical protein